MNFKLIVFWFCATIVFIVAVNVYTGGDALVTAAEFLVALGIFLLVLLVGTGFLLTHSPQNHESSRTQGELAHGSFPQRPA